MHLSKPCAATFPGGAVGDCVSGPSSPSKQHPQPFSHSLVFIRQDLPFILAGSDPLVVLCMPCDHTQDDVLHVQGYVHVWPKFSFKKGNRKRYSKSERTGEMLKIILNCREYAVIFY